MNMKHLLSAALIIGLAGAGIALAGPTPSAPDAKVFFDGLKNGDTVKSPLKVVFGLSGMEIAPAGTDKPNTGHHHLLIDRPEIGKGADGAEEFNVNILSDANNVHYGKGQTETMLELAPGPHTLQLVFGDKDHIPHNLPVVSEVITVTVK
jgi:Domain of unknown function (DUF4399)